MLRINSRRKKHKTQNTKTIVCVKVRNSTTPQFLNLIFSILSLFWFLTCVMCTELDCSLNFGNDAQKNVRYPYTRVPACQLDPLSIQATTRPDGLTPVRPTTTRTSRPRSPRSPFRSSPYSHVLLDGARHGRR